MHCLLGFFAIPDAGIPRRRPERMACMTKIDWVNTVTSFIFVKFIQWAKVDHDGSNWWEQPYLVYTSHWKIWNCQPTTLVFFSRERLLVY